MEKKKYVKPSLECETFVPDTYVAACGDSGVVYKFKCDAGDGVWGSVYMEKNGQSGLQTGRYGDQCIATYRTTLWGTPISGYHACGSTHEANKSDGFYEGYYCRQGNTDNPTKVIIWRGENNNDVHCTTQLDESKWETVKS